MVKQTLHPYVLGKRKKKKNSIYCCSIDTTHFELLFGTKMNIKGIGSLKELFEQEFRSYVKAQRDDLRKTGKKKSKFRKRIVPMFPSKIIPLPVPKRRSHPLKGGSKLRWHVSGSSFGANTRQSAIAH